MKNCKYCDAELLEPSTVCPKCGKDNAGETDQLPAAQAPAELKSPAEAEAPVEAEAPRKLSAGKSVLAIAAMVVAVILLIAVALNSLKPAQEDAENTQPTVQETEPAATIPEDGNPDDVTCKGTYYASDDAVLAARDTVVATAGDLELTLGQLQVFYWMEVQNFLNQYGAYAAYFGLDIQQSLDTQICSLGEPAMTWQQFFLNSALKNWASFSTVSAAAEIDGFALPQAQLQSLDDIQKQMETAAEANNFASADEMLRASLGAAATMEDYRSFLELAYRANGYYAQLAADVTYTDEDLENFYDSHADEYAQQGIGKDDVLVNVRHILIYPEGADGSNIFTEEFSEEAWTAGETAAQALLDQWMEGDMTEESFAALANANSQDPGSNTNGGLYTDVTEGEMVQTFNDWCFDPERQVGDTGIVRTEYGFHVMYFSGSHPKWPDYARSDYVGEHAMAQIAAIEEASPMTVHFADILLCNINLA